MRPGTPEFGPAFETWLLHELVCHRDYAGASPISHWRSASGYEVDFVLGDHTAVEVKAKQNVAPRELRGSTRSPQERPIQRALCVSLDPRPRQVGDVRILPYGDFLDALWAESSAPDQPTQARALRKSRIQGLSSPQPSGCQDIWTVRKTRSGCGMTIVKRPSAVVTPVIPRGRAVRVERVASRSAAPRLSTKRIATMRVVAAPGRR